MKTYHSSEAKIPTKLKAEALTNQVGITTNGRLTHILISHKQYLELLRGKK